MSSYTVMGVGVEEPLRAPVDDIGSYILHEIQGADHGLEEGDIIVVSSKLVSMAQGRIYDLNDVRGLDDSEESAAKSGQPPSLVEIALRESEGLVGAVDGIVVTLRAEGLTPNSGIDFSNAPHGMAILPPLRPFTTTVEIRWRLERLTGLRLGVILVDSRVQPLRRGTIGVAMGYSGIAGVIDQRGREDIFGNKLRYTFRAIADCVGSAAQLVMGEAGEMIPIAIVRGLSVFIDRRHHGPDEIAVDAGECLYMRAIGGIGRMMRLTCRPQHGRMHLI